MPTSSNTADLQKLLRDDRSFRRLARRLVAADADADDVLQEAGLAALESAPQELRRPRSWLARVVANFARKRQREESRRRIRERSVARAERVAASPAEALERAELRRRVLEAVLALREPYRSTIVLRFLEEMRVDRVAELQGVPVGTVKTRSSRALQLLRERLTRAYGAPETWIVLIASLVFPSTAASAASAAARADGLSRSAAGSCAAKAGVCSMSVKAVTTSVCLSVAIAAAVGAALYESSRDGGQERTVASRAGTNLESDRIAAKTEHRSGTAERGHSGEWPGAIDGSASPAEPTALAPSGANRTEGVEARRAADDEGPPGLAPAQSEARTWVRATIEELRELFGEGGRKGWQGVGRRLAELAEFPLEAEEALDELLGLWEEETDAAFLEAVMHHLPLAGTGFQKRILADTELHEGIWELYETEESPEKRMALLRFFAYSPTLSSSRMGHFASLAQTDEHEVVRQLAVDAVASNRELLAETWSILAHVYEFDSAATCRETAIRGLAHVEDERAAALVTAAFSAPEESVRAAALGSAAGKRIPAVVTGGDTSAYLLGEFRAAASRSYKEVLIERLIEIDQAALRDELHRSIESEKDWAIRRTYRKALERIDGEVPTP